MSVLFSRNNAFSLEMLRAMAKTFLLISRELSPRMLLVADQQCTCSCTLTMNARSLSSMMMIIIVNAIMERSTCGGLISHRCRSVSDAGAPVRFNFRTQLGLERKHLVSCRNQPISVNTWVPYLASIGENDVFGRIKG